MPTEVDLVREPEGLDGLLAESVLLGAATKEVLMARARTWGAETLSAIRRTLSEQKTFVVSYLKSRLRADSLGTDAATLAREMRLEYLAYLRSEEERFRKSETLTATERLESANFRA